MIKRTNPDLNVYETPWVYPRPVLSGSGRKGAFDEKSVDIPFVFKHHRRYYMLYTGYDGVGYQSALAVSDDLLHWTHSHMVLQRRPDSGRWDRGGGAAVWLLKESDSLWEVPRLKKAYGRYWMVYHSYPGEGYETGPARIGLAWTEDERLRDWHFLDQPVLSWEDGASWEEGGLYKACIVSHGGVWYMFYNAKTRGEPWIEQTGVAFSEDLLHWRRYEKNPVLTVTPGAWDAVFVSDPYIVRDKERWLNFYYGIGTAAPDGLYHAQDGLAVSEDLLHWEKVEAPLVGYGEPGTYWSGHAHKAAMFYENGTLYHFFCGTCPWKEEYPNRVFDEYRTICVAASRPLWPPAQ